MEKDVSFALKMFDVNCCNDAQKALGQQFLPFVKIFDVTPCNDQAFSFALLSPKKMHRFNECFVKICEDFLAEQTDGFKINFLNNLIKLAKAL